MVHRCPQRNQSTFGCNSIVACCAFHSIMPTVLGSLRMALSFGCIPSTERFELKMSTSESTERFREFDEFCIWHMCSILAECQ